MLLKWAKNGNITLEKPKVGSWRDVVSDVSPQPRDHSIDWRANHRAGRTRQLETVLFVDALTGWETNCRDRWRSRPAVWDHMFICATSKASRRRGCRPKGLTDTVMGRGVLICACVCVHVCLCACTVCVSISVEMLGWSSARITSSCPQWRLRFLFFSINVTEYVRYLNLGGRGVHQGTVLGPLPKLNLIGCLLSEEGGLLPNPEHFH